MQPHNRDDRITKLIDIDYLGDAALAPRFERFLTEIFNKDTELIDYSQRAIGHSFTADQREQCMHFLWGKGANGKTTFNETMLKAAGDYGHIAPAELLLERKFGDAIPTDRADLAGKRFVVVNETGEGRALAEALVKTMTGGELCRLCRFDPKKGKYLYTRARREFPLLGLQPAQPAQKNKPYGSLAVQSRVPYRQKVRTAER